METANLLLKLGYPSNGQDDPSALDATICAGLEDSNYRQIVMWLSNEIKLCGVIDETVTSVDDLAVFAMEISSFLKELACPYRALVEEPSLERYRSDRNARLLVDFLVGECSAHAMVIQKQQAERRETWAYQQEPSTVDDLQKICNALRINYENKCANTLFDEINTTLDRALAFSDSNVLFRPETNLTDEQWVKVEKFNFDLVEEYSVRRLMMLKRLDLTMKSFQWKAENAIESASIYRRERRHLAALVANMTRKDISNLLVADNYLMLQERISSTRLKGSGKNVFQGYLTLADRGGKVEIDEQPTMPDWSSREEGYACEKLKEAYKKPTKQKQQSLSKKNSGNSDISRENNKEFVD